MADIAMCAVTNCPKKETCYRFNATPDKYQSYISPKRNADGSCDYYWEMKKQEVKK